jgi:NodT family efflux transporter outer membrane factor (OMF) lipoprotein
MMAAGCSVGPNYQKPDLPVPAAWTEAQQKGVDARSAELARWWSTFDDPLLNSLVERAVRSNLDLRLAEARIREARASRVVTASGAWPTLNVSGSYTRNRASQNGVAVPGEGTVIVPPSGGANLDQNFYQSGFDANWAIDVFGGVRRTRRGGGCDIRRDSEDRRDVLVTLLGEVARNYIDLRGFQRQLAVARANLETQQHTFELTQVRFQAGLASDLDVAQQEAQLNTTASQIPTLESGLKQAAYALDVLLGSQPGALWGELAKEAEIPNLPPKCWSGCPPICPAASGCSSRRTTTGRRNGAGGSRDGRFVPEVFLTGIAVCRASASDWLTAQQVLVHRPEDQWPV